MLNNSNNQIDDDFSFEIYGRGRHAVTMSANYEVGDTETAYARILVEMKAAGYVVPFRSSGNETDRSRVDIAIIGYLNRHCVQRETIEAVLLKGSKKAIERGTKYLEKTTNAALNQR